MSLYLLQPLIDVPGSGGKDPHDTGLELVIRQAMIRYLFHSATAAIYRSSKSSSWKGQIGVAALVSTEMALRNGCG
ncbi:hypothetical protein TNCV_2950141 [Trichonephila clavipes]|nr:hypothetical protein TNCV_2950141 [Trichonephila clavipes]